MHTLVNNLWVGSYYRTSFNIIVGCVYNTFCNPWVEFRCRATCDLRVRRLIRASWYLQVVIFDTGLAASALAAGIPHPRRGSSGLSTAERRPIKTPLGPGEPANARMPRDAQGSRGRAAPPPTANPVSRAPLSPSPTLHPPSERAARSFTPRRSVPHISHNASLNRGARTGTRALLTLRLGTLS